MRRLVDSLQDQNCSKCFFAMPIEQEGVHLLGDKPEQVYICMRQPPQVSFVPTPGRVQGGVAFNPISQFPAVQAVHVCGEFMDATEVEHA